MHFKKYPVCSKCLIIISYILVKLDMEVSCSEPQARMRKCQKNRHMPGPTGGLLFTDWALFVTISGIKAK